MWLQANNRRREEHRVVAPVVLVVVRYTILHYNYNILFPEP